MKFATASKLLNYGRNPFSPLPAFVRPVLPSTYVSYVVESDSSSYLNSNSDDSDSSDVDSNDNPFRRNSRSRSRASTSAQEGVGKAEESDSGSGEEDTPPPPPRTSDNIPTYQGYNCPNGSPFYTAGHFWIHQKFNSPDHSGCGTFTIVAYRYKPSVEDDGSVRQFLTEYQEADEDQVKHMIFNENDLQEYAFVKSTKHRGINVQHYETPYAVRVAKSSPNFPSETISNISINDVVVTQHATNIISGKNLCDTKTPKSSNLTRLAGIRMGDNVVRACAIEKDILIQINKQLGGSTASSTGTSTTLTKDELVNTLIQQKDHDMAGTNSGAKLGQVAKMECYVKQALAHAKTRSEDPNWDGTFAANIRFECSDGSSINGYMWLYHVKNGGILLNEGQKKRLQDAGIDFSLASTMPSVALDDLEDVDIHNVVLSDSDNVPIMRRCVMKSSKVDDQSSVHSRLLGFSLKEVEDSEDEREIAIETMDVPGIVLYSWMNMKGICKKGIYNNSKKKTL